MHVSRTVDLASDYPRFALQQENHMRAYRASLKGCSELPAIRAHKNAGSIGVWSGKTCINCV
jgi:hypothetical protein